jgi:hypothetical protein
MKTLLATMAILAVLTGGAANAANFYATPRWLGGTIIHIDGDINFGDEQRFERIVSQYPSNTTIVEPNSFGGNVKAALLIGAIIEERGLSTWISSNDTCNSACPWIWFAGRHSTIERDATMCFHQPSDPRTGKVNPEIVWIIVEYLKHLGLTDFQARSLVNAAVPESARCATEWWAYRLGFNPQIVLLARFCQAKYCLVIQ